MDLAKYNDLLNRLASEAVSCTPPSWKTGTLTITCDGRRMDYKLKNPTEAEKAVLSDPLRSLCEQLYVAMRNDGHVWTECALDFFENEEGAWGIKVRFGYPPEGGSPAAVPPPLPTQPPPL